MSRLETGAGGDASSSSSDTNLLVIMADEHTRSVLGAMGNRNARTPNLDRLARSGTVFPHSYSASPICVPARAALATGRYVHQLGCWDNHNPYDGSQAQSWGHLLQAAGRRVATVGKLHYRSADAPTGFSEQLMPMHVSPDGGGVRGLLRGDMPPVQRMRAHVQEAGEGESEYTLYDRRVAQAAAQWLRDVAPREQAPWALQVSFVSPHFPLVCPAEYLDSVDREALPFPVDGDVDVRTQHPAVQTARRLQCQDVPMTRDLVMKAVAAYYGLVAFVDAQIGLVLEALESSGASDRTRVVYTSDHGEMLGEHGLWWKSSMYEGSVGVPLILAGPGIPVGEVNPTPVSSVDLYPTLLEWSGASGPADRDTIPGRSLNSFLRHPQADRVVFSEYHAVFSESASYMITPIDGRYKYVHHVGHPAQLFDLLADPDEMHDLSAEPGYGQILRHGEDRLREILDPVGTDRRAKESQRERADLLGGKESLLAIAGSFTHTPPPGERRT